MITPAPNPMLAQIGSYTKDPYYAEFGYFITGFARTEGMVRKCLLHLLNMTQTDGAALFPNLSVNEAVTIINRLLTSRNEQTTLAELKEPFARLQKIAEVRNALVHWDSAFDNVEGLSVRNTHRAHVPDKAVEYRVSSRQLIEMLSDLIKIDIHILHTLRGPADGASLPGFHEKVVRPILDADWAYQPSKN